MKRKKSPVRPCRKCDKNYDHDEFRTCPQCEWVSRDLWRRRNRDRINRDQRIWRKRNPEKVKEYARRWRELWGPLAWHDEPYPQMGRA